MAPFPHPIDLRGMNATDGPQPLSPVVMPLPARVRAAAPLVLHDPDTWIGVVIGACAVLAIIALYRAAIASKWSFYVWRRRFRNIDVRRASGMSLSQSLRASLALSDPEEITWYECIEDGVGDFLGQLAVPLLSPPVKIDKTNPSNMRLTRLCGDSCPQIRSEDRAEDECRTSWSAANAADLAVRCGPDYVRQGRKEPSAPAMYECVSCEAVRAGCIIENPIPRLGPLPAGGAGWHKGLGIPRVLTVNGQNPWEEGPKMFGVHPVEDGGSSLMGTFVVTAEVIRVAALDFKAKQSGGDPPDPSDEPILPAVRLLQELYARGTLELPLPKGQKVGFSTAGALKAIGFIEDFQQVEGIPSLLRPAIGKNNGKPALLTNFAKMFKDESGADEWMCIDFDIRKMTWLSRSLLAKLRHRLKEINLHEAFLIQGTKDHELPEVVLANVLFHGVDIINTPWIDDPAAPPGSSPTASLPGSPTGEDAV